MQGSSLLQRNNYEEKSSSKDIVTDFDKKCQKIIKDIISHTFPSHKFLAEEDVEPGRTAAIIATKNMVGEENLWIIDPIDGTTNFVYGMPLSGGICLHIYIPSFH